MDCTSKDTGWSPLRQLMSDHADTIVDLGDAVQEMSEDVGETAKENCNGSIIDTGHTYAITATSPVR